MSTSLDEIEIVDLTSKPIKKTGYKGGEAYHLMPPEEQRATKKSPYVKGDFKKFLATAQSGIQAFFDEYKDYVWIFYDTETTGLGTGGYTQKTGEVKPAAKSFQVTQWGAAAVDFNDFESEYEIVDTYNPKQHLDPAVKFRMGKEKERAAAAEKAGEKKQPFERTVEFPLSMTRYGEKKKHDPETGKKTTKSRFQTRLRNTLGFAEFIKNAEEETGKPAILVAHNLPYDAKAIGSEFERARKEAWELRKEKVTSYEEYAWMNETLTGTYPGLDTVQIFKQVLKPIVEKLKYFVETGVATEKEAAIVDNMITKAGNVSVSLGPTRQAFGVEDKGWHDALADVEMTMEVFDVVRMFIAHYDPSLEEPEQMSLPFGEEGKNPEEDPQLTAHLRENNMLEITKTRLQEIIKEEQLKIESKGGGGPGRNRTYKCEDGPHGPDRSDCIGATIHLEADDPLNPFGSSAEGDEAAELAAQTSAAAPYVSSEKLEEEEDDKKPAKKRKKVTKEDVMKVVREELDSMISEAEKPLQKLAKGIEKRGTEGDFSEWCGGEVTQACIDRAAKEGGKRAKQASLAATFSKAKGGGPTLTYPKGKD